MPTINVGPGSGLELQAIADVLGKSRKVVVITGAGISTNCGIPDFRSENGLYSLIQAQYDAAAKDPSAYTEEIDTRPTKRRRVTERWTYVTVSNETGQVVTDPALELPPPDRSSSRSKSVEESLQTSGTSSDSDSIGASRPRRTLRSQLSEEISFDACQSLNKAALGSRASSPQIRSRRSSPLSSQTQDTKPQNSTRPSLLAASSQDKSRTSSRSNSPAQYSRSRNYSFQDLLITKQSESNLSVEASEITVSTTVVAPNTSKSSNCSRSLSEVDRQRPSLQRQSSSILQSQETDDSSSQPTSSQSSSRASLPNLKGKDLFDSMIWSDAFTTSVFYRFISTLRQKVNEDVTKTTESHRFIKTLRDTGRLVRNYTQNIDCLEAREGLSTELELGTGDRARFSTRASKETGGAKKPISGGDSQPGGVEVVQLHGSLVNLRCGVCSRTTSWDEEERFTITSAGQAPECPSCEFANADRCRRGRRGLAVGRLRPDIVLYGEEHPSAHLISPLIQHDLGLGPEILLILGTSLRVHGLKVMVREFAKAVHTKGGKVIFVNNTKPSESVWGDVIDYWVEWDCDAWVLDLKKRREEIWLPPGTSNEKKSKRQSLCINTNDPKKPPVRPSATRDCKVNGVHLTFKILETLGKILDSDGQKASRLFSFQQEAPPTSIKEDKTFKKRVAQTTCKSKTLSSKNKEAQLPDTEQTRQYEIQKAIHQRLHALSPQATREALLALSPNIEKAIPKTYAAFEKFSASPYLLSTTTLPGLSWPLPMNLATHPPNETGLPQLRASRVCHSSGFALALVAEPALHISTEQKTPSGPTNIKQTLRTKMAKSSACETCRSKRRRCDPSHIKTVVSRSSSPLSQSDTIVVDSPEHEDTQKLPDHPRPIPRDVQESVDAQLLREVTGPANKDGSRVACKVCKKRRRRCTHRPSLPAPTSSWSSDTIVVDSDQEIKSLPTPPATSDSVTLTPSAQRIKNMGRIGAVLLSPPRTRSVSRALSPVRTTRSGKKRD
ncbi:hypothetical protein BP5796_05129 [Coleophoma crateriformis]|uniref:Deacetylase sirtuin-type domain-containing protein n=1 Tax=Coleophoma crateriformis TaxID=565419 RepID=A0A3D8S2V6_9HELO|nr:hypothetical protein BP5796_05129 [Coleophoma crateriformis]